MTHITCRLTTKNRDQLRNPTLGNRVWPTFLLVCTRLSRIDVSCMRCDTTEVYDC